jgi:hypothetical protein
MLITRVSNLSGELHSININVTPEQLQAYEAQRGLILIQDAFPTLHAWEREFIKTGVTPAEWDAVFANEED